MAAARSCRGWNRPIGPAITATARMPEAARKPALNPSLCQAGPVRVEANMLFPPIPMSATNKQFSDYMKYRKVDFGTLRLRGRNESFDLLATRLKAGPAIRVRRRAL